MNSDYLPLGGDDWQTDFAMAHDEASLDGLDNHNEADDDSDGDYEPGEEEWAMELEDAQEDLVDGDVEGERPGMNAFDYILSVQNPGFSTEGSRRRREIRISSESVRRLLAGASAGIGGTHRGIQRLSYHQWFPEVNEPLEAGLELLFGGEFGRVRNKAQLHRKDSNFSRRIRNRISHSRRGLHREDMASDLIPNSHGTAVARYGCRIYCGQFSSDSSLYYTCGQDFRMHIYDTTSPPVPRRPTFPSFSRRSPDYGYDTTMKVLNCVQGSQGSWTISDSHLSPDNERMIYSSLTPTVHMTNIHDPAPAQIPIRFEDEEVGGWSDDSIWSCRFSADGNEIVAGGSGKIFVYDLLMDRRKVRITAHDDDVNSCCWADAASGNILVSASDDTSIKVWDRRSLGSSLKPSGVLIGHTEGVTYVSAKGDGRYIISNGKDQAMRLWDLRKMRSSSEFCAVESGNYTSGFDYRFNAYPKPRYKAHPKDCSVMTYRGHAVLRTLIRCHFSPAETTGGQYLYSGSADGRIHIWSLDGRIVQILDRAKTLPMPSDSSRKPEINDFQCVRDVSWHSQEPVLMSTASEWESDYIRQSVIARHEWKGLQNVSGGLEDWVEKRNTEDATSPGRTRRLHVPGAFRSNFED